MHVCLVKSYNACCKYLYAFENYSHLLNYIIYFVCDYQDLFLKFLNHTLDNWALQQGIMVSKLILQLRIEFDPH